MKKTLIKSTIVCCLSLSMAMPMNILAAQGNYNVLIESNIISKSYNQQSMSEIIKRGEFVSLINKAFNFYTTAGNQFADVATDSPYYFDFMAARYKGYLSGTGNNNANPDGYITNAEVAVILSDLINDKVSNNAIVKDLSSAPAWAKDSISKIVSANVMQLDSNGKFNPNQKLTRGQIYDILEGIAESKANISRVDEIINIPSFDKYSLQGRLSLPVKNDTVDKLVIYVNGTGPNTYVDQRLAGDYRFNYFDWFSQPFAEDGTAFFSYNQRGVTIGDKPPTFDNINQEQYKTYIPQNSAKDIKYMVDYFRNDPRFTNAKIYLLGWSEGTIIAPHAVVDEGAKVDGLILAGYVNGNLKEDLDYQLNGTSTFLYLCNLFNCYDKGKITKEDFDANPNALPVSYVGTFDEYDTNKDGIITEEDFYISRKPARDEFWNAYENKDENYFLNDYPVPITYEWLNAHLNYGNNIDTLKKVNMPIYILQGSFDRNVPYQGALDAEKTFKDMGKTNLQVTIFDGEDHDLNISDILATKQYSEGCKKLFDIVRNGEK